MPHNVHSHVRNSSQQNYNTIHKAELNSEIMFITPGVTPKGMLWYYMGTSVLTCPSPAGRKTLIQILAGMGFKKGWKMVKN